MIFRIDGARVEKAPAIVDFDLSERRFGLLLRVMNRLLKVMECMAPTQGNRSRVLPELTHDTAPRAFTIDQENYRSMNKTAICFPLLVKDDSRFGLSSRARHRRPQGAHPSAAGCELVWKVAWLLNHDLVL